MSTVKGFTELKTSCDNIANGLLGVVIQSFEKIATNSTTRIKQDAPVDTGFMRDEVKKDRPSSISVRIKANAYYSIFVDHGHRTRSGSHVAPNPFFSDEVNRLKSGVLKNQVDKDVDTFINSQS